jgi:hypothetical protein
MCQCSSANQQKFLGEMCIRRPGLKHIADSIVLVWPELVVCLNCGAAEFLVPESELHQLAKGDTSAAGYLSH